MTIEEINQSYQDFQDELAIRELHLKFFPSFKDESMDDLLDLLNELRGATPIFDDKGQPTPGNVPEKITINIL